LLIMLGLGVRLLSDRRDFLPAKPFVLTVGFMIEADSEIGGDGGVGRSDPEASDLLGGGVEMVGDGGVTADISEVMERGLAGFKCIACGFARL